MRSGNSQNTRGFILIIVVAVLGVLAFFALDFVRVSQTSRELSKRQVWKTTSRLAARSGVEKAVIGLRLHGWQTLPPVTPFSQTLAPRGEDANHNGALDSGEDLDGDGKLDFHCDLGSDLSPSLPLEAWPPTTPPSAMIRTSSGSRHGVTWLDERDHPTMECFVQIHEPQLDLNGGILSGRGESGGMYAREYKSISSYESSNSLHPFNLPTVRMFNSWGNAAKYAAMVRPGKTYDWSKPIDDDRNAYQASEVATATLFDVFQSSEICPGETPLGLMLVSARPPGGFADLEEPAKIVEGYIRNWRDAAGNPAYPSGTWQRAGPSNIDPITDTKIRDIVCEFKATTDTHPFLTLHHMISRSTTYDLVPSTGNQFLCYSASFHDDLRFFPFMELPVNINRAPPLVLAALCHSLENPKVWHYAPWVPGANSVRGLSHVQLFPAPGENNYHSGIHASLPMMTRSLFSMTEAVSFAATIAARRSRSPFAGFTDLEHHIHSSLGYDGRESSAQLGCKLSDANNNSKFHDIHHGNCRQRILMHFLNPSLNLGCRVFDESLHSIHANTINGIGIHGLQHGNRRLDQRFFLDKIKVTETGTTAIFSGSYHRISSKGLHMDPHGAVLSSTCIVVRVKSSSLARIHSQRQWLGAGLDPSHPSWVSYPEAPGANPSEIEGHLALKPRWDHTNSLPFGTDLRLRMPLHAFDMTRHPAKDLSIHAADAWPEGFRHPGKINFRNSLNPSPDVTVMPPLFPGPPPSGVPVSDHTFAASDLAPGGGYFVSPFNNTDSVPSGSPLGETILTLRNTLCSDGEDVLFPKPNVITSPNKVMDGFEDGVISFWFKPRFTPPLSSQENSIRGHTLFYWPFLVRDMETEARALPAEAAFRSWFQGSLRLVWGSLFRNSTTFYGMTTSFNRNIRTGSVKWPYIQGYPVANWPGFNQSNFGPFFFAEGRGLTLGGSSGHLPCFTTRLDGTVSNTPDFFDQTNFNQAAGESSGYNTYSRNPFPNENLFLEMAFVKYASMDEITGNWSLGGRASHLHYAVWDSEDIPGLTGQSGAYVAGLAIPLHLFDTTDPAHPEYHCVRKLFIIGHPVVTSGARAGEAPRDRQGSHQALVAPGRWNHFLLAWRNMYQLMNNTLPNHRGGSLAVYINGALRKSVAGFEIAGLQLNTDFCDAYKKTNPVLNWQCTWEPLQNHSLYSTGFYTTGQDMGMWKKSLHMPFTTCSDISQFSNVDARVPIPFPGNQGPLTGSPTDMSRQWHWAPAHGAFEAVAAPLFNNFPSRFYFGGQPQVFFDRSLNYGIHFMVGGMPWGAYMDIQIFENPSPSIFPSPDDGGFAAELPGFDSHSPLPSDATLVLTPLAAGSVERGHIAGVSWTARLPEYHNFWDDQNHSTAPGADGDDTQSLTLDIMVRDRDPVTGIVNGPHVGHGQLRLTQDPNTSLPPSTTGHLQPSSPLPFDTLDDLEVRLGFRGPQLVFGTPLIESIEAHILLDTPLFQGYQLD